MRNLVFLAFLALLGFGVAGWYLDWYSVARSPSENGRTRIEVEVDSQKIRADTGKGIDKIKTKLQNSSEKNKSGSEVTKEAAKPAPATEKEEKLSPPKPPV